MGLLDIRSGALRYCINSYLLLAAWLGGGVLHAQLALGRVEGDVRTIAGNAMPAVGVAIEGGGLRVIARTDGEGRFALALPHGSYRVSLENDSSFAAPVDISPLETVRITVWPRHFVFRQPLPPRRANGWGML